METTIRVFGRRAEDANYSLRPGGYAVIGNTAGQVALVFTNGGFFLPGGGQKSGESTQDAAIREIREETGLDIHIDHLIAVADQLVYANDYGNYVQKRCHFFSARLANTQTSIERGEAEHELVWLEPTQAVAQLRHESQRWAVARWRQMTFWDEFVRAGIYAPGHIPAEIPDAWSFGDSPEMADKLGRLVYDGVKSATCGALWEYEHDGEPLPQPGALSIILDGAELPLCVIETGDVQVRPYNEVDAAFAHAEGEGDRTLAWWRQAHWRFFSRTLPRIGRQPSETMPLVCEQFRVVFRA